MRKENQRCLFLRSIVPNLSLDVRRGYSASDKLRFLLALIARHKNESGIIYCLSRKTTESVAEKLKEKGVRP